jgi:hypothetical protein
VTLDALSIRRLAIERPQDLHDLLMGTSEFCVAPTSEVVSVSSYDWALVIHHLLYVIKFGPEDTSDGRWVNDRFYPSHASAFEEWLLLGAPGLAPDDVCQYMNKYPLLP